MEPQRLCLSADATRNAMIGASMIGTSEARVAMLHAMCVRGCQQCQDALAAVAALNWAAPLCEACGVDFNAPLPPQLERINAKCLATMTQYPGKELNVYSLDVSVPIKDAEGCALFVKAVEDSGAASIVYHHADHHAKATEEFITLLSQCATSVPWKVNIYSSVETETLEEPTAHLIPRLFASAEEEMPEALQYMCKLGALSDTVRFASLRCTYFILEGMPATNLLALTKALIQYDEAVQDSPAAATWLATWEMKDLKELIKVALDVVASVMQTFCGAANYVPKKDYESNFREAWRTGADVQLTDGRVRVFETLVSGTCSRGVNVFVSQLCVENAGYIGAFFGGNGEKGVGMGSFRIAQQCALEDVTIDTFLRSSGYENARALCRICNAEGSFEEKDVAGHSNLVVLRRKQPLAVTQ